MPAPSAAELAALEHDYRFGETRLIRQHSHIVLLAYDLDSQDAIARAVRCSRATVNRTLQRFRASGRAGLRRPARAAPRALWKNPAWRQALAQAMEQGPEACGVSRPTWTAPLLATYLGRITGLPVGERTVRRGLDALDYVCRRPTWTVRHKAEEQPDYVPKARGSKRS
jgi:transposase